MGQWAVRLYKINATSFDTDAFLRLLDDVTKEAVVLGCHTLCAAQSINPKGAIAVTSRNRSAMIVSPPKFEWGFPLTALQKFMLGSQ